MGALEDTWSSRDRVDGGRSSYVDVSGEIYCDATDALYFVISKSREIAVAKPSGVDDALGVYLPDEEIAAGLERTGRGWKVGFLTSSHVGVARSVHREPRDIIVGTTDASVAGRDES